MIWQNSLRNLPSLPSRLYSSSSYRWYDRAAHEVDDDDDDDDADYVDDDDDDDDADDDADYVDDDDDAMPGVCSVPASVVDPNTLNLDPDPGFWLNLDPDPDPGFYYRFWKKKLKIILD